MHVRFKAAAVIAAVMSVPVVLAGCASTPASTGEDHTELSTHVHAVVVAPESGQLLLGTHEGIYEVSEAGELGGRVSTADFDAMGLTATSQGLIASGHPGPQTPEEWGAPNLGVIRSVDGGANWEPVAFTGEKDFHALTAGADDTVYGLATDDTNLLRSVDAGATWTPAGAQVPAVSLTADASGRVVAATADGVTVSTDRGASFAAWPDAPLLYTLGASPDRKRLVGVGTDDRIWVLGSGEDQWREAGTVHEQAQAVGIDADGRIVVVDASGITVLPQ